MAKSKKEKKEGLQTIGQTVSKFEAFLEKNNKIILAVACVIVVGVVGFMLYNNFIRKPKIKEAAEIMYKAEEYFAIDSFKLALQGDGVFPGFEEIIDEYGSTPSGKLANYYAGVCYMRLGEFETAIDYLKEYSSNDAMAGPMAVCLIGDANFELGNKAEAVSYYLKAAKKANNDMLSPLFLLKAGETCELMEDFTRALSIYERIDKEYFGSEQQRNIERYIERVKAKMN